MLKDKLDNLESFKVLKPKCIPLRRMQEDFESSSIFKNLHVLPPCYSVYEFYIDEKGRIKRF